jgi:hypothetical protein
MKQIWIHVERRWWAEGGKGSVHVYVNGYRIGWRITDTYPGVHNIRPVLQSAAEINGLPKYPADVPNQDVYPVYKWAEKHGIKISDSVVAVNVGRRKDL